MDQETITTFSGTNQKVLSTIHIILWKGIFKSTTHLVAIVEQLPKC